MLSVLPSSSVSVAGARVNLNQDRSRMHDFQVKVSSNFPVHGLCIPNGSMGGHGIQSSGGSIIKPLTTTCTTTNSREYVRLAPQLYPLLHSPKTKASVNSIPLSSINSELHRNNFKAGGTACENLTGLDKTSLGNGSTVRTSEANIGHSKMSRTSEELSKNIVGPGQSNVVYYSENSINSSTISVPSRHFNFPFPNPNVYSRQFIHMKPNYPMLALSNDGVHNPATTTAAQVPSCAIPNFDNSIRFSYASPSSTLSHAFPFPPPLLPPLIPQHSLSIPPLIRECSNLPLFTGVYHSPSPFTTSSSNSPNKKSPSNLSHRPNLSHHSSLLEITKNGKSVTFETTSSSNFKSKGDEKPAKPRMRIPSSENHPKNAGIFEFSTEKHPSSNSISNNANLQHAVHELYITTPKQPKSSPSLSTYSCSPKIQPRSLPMQPATSQNRHFTMGLNEATGKKCAKIMCSVHFNKGSTIQLPNGSFKCVQDLSIDDFVKSAKESENLQIDSSTVVSIDVSDKLGNNGMTVTLSLAVGIHRLQMSVEASVEQPWFVLGKGWSSCCPSLTLRRFSLNAHQLSVGDVCVSLTRKQNGRHFPTTAPKSRSGRKRRYSE